MADRFQAPRGTSDVLPADAAARARVEQTAREILERAGYGRIETPVFEDTELFARGVGRLDRHRPQGDVHLRGQGRAQHHPAARGHGADLPRLRRARHAEAAAAGEALVRTGPLFRHERPQAGRFRQFPQLDAEVIGSDSPLVDAELIMLLDELLRGLEVPELTCGSAASARWSRAAPTATSCIAYLREHEDELADDVRERIDENPLRAFDSKDQGTQRVMAEAPTMLDRLDGEDAEHFETVRRLLDQAGIAYEVDATLVRGLDYYTRTVFEFHCDRLGAQSQVAGGGRYDGLIELLGGPRTPAIGWAAGVERILLAIESDGEELPP